jgi:hypothetical protein
VCNVIPGSNKVSTIGVGFIRAQLVMVVVELATSLMRALAVAISRV